MKHTGLVAIGIAMLGGVVAGSQPSAWHGYAIDGDTFTRGGIHYRIEHIDAPEMPGHCRGYREAHGSCAVGDPYASQRGLQAELNRGIHCRGDGLDFYRRTLVTCTTREGADLGRLLINAGLAQPYSYKGR